MTLMKWPAGFEMIDRFTGEFEPLGNFHLHPVVYAGVDWPSNEHGFQAVKPLDPVVRLQIRNLRSPSAAKHAGRRVELRPDWEHIKSDVMLDLVTRKFMDPGLSRLLLDTGDRTLVEGNAHGDDTWGAVRKNDVWMGENRLGRILMVVRRRLRAEWLAVPPEDT